jgi:DNA-binding transcriptional MerR regulator
MKCGKGDLYMKMKIGEFAAFSNVSIRALRLYDRMGLLTPSQVDTESGYRYYLPDQLQTLNTILSFKKVGFSLKEIKDMISAHLSREAVIKRLRLKQHENERTVTVCQYNIENIQKMLDALSATPEEQDEQRQAQRLSRIACLENDKLEHDFSQILWL